MSRKKVKTCFSRGNYHEWKSRSGSISFSFSRDSTIEVSGSIESFSFLMCSIWASSISFDCQLFSSAFYATEDEISGSDAKDNKVKWRESQAGSTQTTAMNSISVAWRHRRIVICCKTFATHRDMFSIKWTGNNCHLVLSLYFLANLHCTC